MTDYSEVTWTLKGHLKNAQISYLRVGSLLARVRDKQLYAALKHPDIVSYGIARLGLQRASLYRYLSVHDWVAQSHPEWLQPKPKGFIPDLADATALIWIERRLGRKDLDPKERAALEDLRAKALAGKLTSEEYRQFRRGNGPRPGLAHFLAQLRGLRHRGEEIEGMPGEALPGLDHVIVVVEKAVVAVRRNGPRHWLRDLVPVGKRRGRAG